MNNKLLTAALVGAASAAVERCENDLVTAAEAAQAGLEAQLAAAEAATAGLTTAAAATAAALTTANTDKATHLGTIQTYLDAAATASAAVAANTATASGATAAIAASTAALVPLNAAVVTAQAAVTAQETKISTQDAEIVELAAAVTRHATELGVLNATVTTKLAAVTAADLAITNQTALVTANTALLTTRAYQSPATVGNCACVYEEPSAGAAWAWKCTDSSGVSPVDCTGTMTWTGLTAYNTAAITKYVGAGEDPAASAGLVGSKKKDAADLLTAYEKTTATIGAGEAEAVAFAALKTLQLQQAVYLTGCVINLNPWSANQDAACINASGSAKITAKPYDMQVGYQALHTSVNTKTSDQATTATANGLAITAYAQALHDMEEAKWEQALTAANVVANGASDTTLKAPIVAVTGSMQITKTTADNEHATAVIAQGVGSTQKAQADTNLARANALLVIMKAELAPLAATLAVKTWQRDQEDLVKAAQTTTESDAQALSAGLLAVQTAAAKANDRAVLSQAFYTGVIAEATTSSATDAGLVAANAALIVSLTAQVASAKMDVATEIAGCKGAAYMAAQKLAKELADQAILDAGLATAVKSAYAAKSAQPTDGTAGTRCEKSAEGVRVACADELCCGAAQKILRDGTKLAVETCQANVGVHTYQYYPPLPADATVEPSPETWRFQCISGAQKLVAAATAALAASYMMA